ncbi:MAG: hypothetical protein K5984_04290 [Bacteroidales bacterium]|nr:hypothetical protein [Bacteroidales bacterium]
MKKRYMIFLAATLVACQPQYDMVPPESIVIEEKEFSENWYISNDGAGLKDGSDWSNALPFDELLTMLTSDAASFSEAGIHIKEGTYTIPTKDEEDFITLACNVLCIRGGYSESLTGDDLSDCNPQEHPTVMTGEKGFAKVAGITALFENIKFTGFKRSVFNINGDNTTTSIECHNCIFDNNKNEIASNSEAGGAGAFITQGYFKAKNCVFTNNSAVSRGGAVRINGKSGLVFLDKCFFMNNSIEKTWGSALQVSAGVLCANNCTMVNNTGAGSTLNGGGAFFISNCTVIDDSDANGSNNAAFRCESKTEAQSMIVNSIFTTTSSDGKGIIVNNNSVLTSKGYNVIKSVYLGSGAVDPCISTDLKKDANLIGSADAEQKCWKWDFNQISSNFTEFATSDDIYDAAMAFDPSAYCSVSVVGRNYATWVTPDAFGEDCRGEKRDSDGFVPGAYESNE